MYGGMLRDVGARGGRGGLLFCFLFLFSENVTTLFGYVQERGIERGRERRKKRKKKGKLTSMIITCLSTRVDR